MVDLTAANMVIGIQHGAIAKPDGIPCTVEQGPGLTEQDDESIKFTLQAENLGLYQQGSASHTQIILTALLNGPFQQMPHPPQKFDAAKRILLAQIPSQSDGVMDAINLGIVTLMRSQQRGNGLGSSEKIGNVVSHCVLLLPMDRFEKNPCRRMK